MRMPACNIPLYPENNVRCCSSAVGYCQPNKRRVIDLVAGRLENWSNSWYLFPHPAHEEQLTELMKSSRTVVRKRRTLSLSRMLLASITPKLTDSRGHSMAHGPKCRRKMTQTAAFRYTSFQNSMPCHMP